MNHDELCCAMRAKIDHAALAIAHQHHPGTTHGKFFDTNTFIHAAALHALRLNAELKPRANCIDIGAGFGYVALALECLGHQCTAWDAPAEVLQAIAPCIPVSHRIFKMIERGKFTQPITRDAFDLIILHGVWPMRDASGWWGSADYSCFFQTLARALAPGGRLEVIINRGDQLDVCCSIPTEADPNICVSILDNVIDARRTTPVTV